ncbi:MAG: hypothetical protein U0X20_14975 [Caldilineaceae bacterium]
MVNLDRLTLGAAAGAATNMVVGGFGARLAMRVVVLLIGGQPAVTFEGTVGILVLAAILGTGLGATVALVHGWVGCRWRRTDWLLGGLLALLVAGIFLTIRDGEAALLPAVQGLLLFAPQALLSMLATGYVFEWLWRSRASKVPRRSPALWLALYGAAFAPAFMGLMSLAGGPLRLPRVAWHMAAMAVTGANMAAAYVPMQMLGFAFALVYLLLTWLLFWLAEGPDLRVAAIGLLLLATGSFHVIGPIESVLGRGMPADGFEVLLAAIGVALLAVVYWRLFTCSPAGVRRAPLTVSLLFVAGAYAALALLISAEPEWRVLRQPLWVTLFSVTLYLLPSLALPLGLLWSRQRTPDRTEGAASYQVGVPADAV